MLNKMIQYRMLKHWGKKICVKVSSQVVDGVQYIYIRDLEFVDFHSALNYLRVIADTETAGEETGGTEPGALLIGKNYARANEKDRKTVKGR